MAKKLKIIIPLALVLSIAIFTIKERRLLLLLATLPSAPALADAITQPGSTSWFDDYFTINPIAPNTIAIGEHRYHQLNYSYLILGEERAILFDSGAGVRDIQPVVKSLTNLPVVATQSHLHFDHMGNHSKFDHLAMPDLPHLRNRSTEGQFKPSLSEHLGFVEGVENPELAISEWWRPGSSVDLGGRTLTVIHSPGHTDDSIMLLDIKNNLLFSGDYIYPGPLFGMVPGADLNAYLKTAQHLLSAIPENTKILAAHGESPSSGAPVLGRTDLSDLKNTLEKIINGTLNGKGVFIKQYPVNARIELWAD